MNSFEVNLMSLDIINLSMKQIIEMIGYNNHFDWSSLKGVSELLSPDELFELDNNKKAMDLIYKSNSRYEINRVMYQLIFDERLNSPERNLMMKSLYMNIQYRKKRFVINTPDYSELTDILQDLSIVIREFLRNTNCECDPMPEKLYQGYESIKELRKSEIIDEFCYIVCDYYDIYKLIDYHKRPVTRVCTLAKNESGEYYTEREIYNYRTEIEFLYTDENGKERWAIDTIVRSTDKGFRLWKHPSIELKGLKIRYRSMSCDDL